MAVPFFEARSFASPALGRLAQDDKKRRMTQNFAKSRSSALREASAISDERDGRNLRNNRTRLLEKDSVMSRSAFRGSEFH